MRIIEQKRSLSKGQKRFYVILFSIITIFSLYLGVGVFILFDMTSFNQDLAKYYWWDSDDCAYTGDRKFKDFYEERVNWTLLEDRAYIYENWTDQYNICNESWDCARTFFYYY